MILRTLGCLYLSGWLIEVVQATVEMHKNGMKSPTYRPLVHCFAMVTTIPVIVLASVFWPFFWYDRRLPLEVRQKRRLEARARRAERLRNKGKRK